MRLFQLCLVLCVATLPAQTISGFVIDKSNSEALIGANVYLDSLNIGSSTNVSGYYVITDVPPGTYTLIASYLGYQTYRATLTMKQKPVRLNIVLEPRLLETEAIVVSGDSIPLIEKMYEKEISQVKLTARQINTIPQIAEADLLRSLQSLPGIVPLSDFSSALYIRGGTPDQNLFLLDGTDVYNPEHAFGLFSTFNTDAIKQVNLSKGGFGAEYGGRLSSIVDVTNLDGNRKQLEGKVGVSLLSARATLQMPIGQKGSVSASLRRTYFDQTVAPFLEDIPDYYFYDGNLKAFLELSPNDKLTLSAYGGRDVLTWEFPSGGEKISFGYNWGNTTGSAKWTHVFTPEWYGDFWITYSRFSSYLNFDIFDAYEDNLLTDLTFKADMQYRFSNDLGFRFGLEQKNFDVNYTNVAPGREVRTSTRPTFVSAFGVANWKIMPRLEMDAGLRFNYLNGDTTLANLAPRLTFKYRLAERTVLKLAAGQYYQYLHRIPRFLIADIWTASGKKLQESSSQHYIMGLQKTFSTDIQLESEIYYKTYNDIYSFDYNFLTRLDAAYYNDKDEPVFTSPASLLNRGDGWSAGFEMTLRKETGPLTGWLGYAFAHTEYTLERINANRPFPPRHDRTHTVNLVAKMKLDRLWNGDSYDARADSSRWVLGLNGVYSSGQAYTEPGSAYLMGVTPDAPYRDVYFAPTRINQVRLPYYARLDVSLTWQLIYKSWKMEPYLQVFNVGNRGNVWFATYDFVDGKPVIDEQYMFPILPTLGVNIEF
ncbi:MAG: TonB-dependent receptor [Calditrichaeota bacterium]|nr:MAG: TonB-dependent receptor [Calditrichota bacterium]